MCVRVADDQETRTGPGPFQRPRSCSVTGPVLLMHVNRYPSSRTGDPSSGSVTSDITMPDTMHSVMDSDNRSTSQTNRSRPPRLNGLKVVRITQSLCSVKWTIKTAQSPMPSPGTLASTPTLPCPDPAGMTWGKGATSGGTTTRRGCAPGRSPRGHSVPGPGSAGLAVRRGGPRRC